MDTTWSWQFASPQVASALGECPEKLLDSAELVKKNPIRKVLRTKDLYFKQDFRRGHHLQHEWESAKGVVGHGIPCVEYLALGRSSEGEVLITRAENGALPVKDHVCMLAHQLSDGIIDRKAVMDFGESLATFALRIIKAKLIHTDYHLGNILFVPSENRFCLVDTCGVRKAHLWDRIFFRRWRMEKIVLGLHHVLDLKDILHLYELEKAANPLDSYERGLQEGVNHLRHSWKKRRKQILEGHHRYTAVEGSWLKVVDEAEQPLNPQEYVVQTGVPDLHSKLLLADALMNAVYLPHQKVYAYNRHTGELHWQKIEASQPCRKVPDDYLIRLNCLGMIPRPEEWRLDNRGRAILVDFKQVCSMEARWNR